jgi:hypothetical protein
VARSNTGAQQQQPGQALQRRQEKQEQLASQSARHHFLASMPQALSIRLLRWPLGQPQARPLQGSSALQPEQQLQPSPLAE